MAHLWHQGNPQVERAGHSHPRPHRDHTDSPTLMGTDLNSTNISFSNSHTKLSLLSCVCFGPEEQGTWGLLGRGPPSTFCLVVTTGDAASCKLTELDHQVSPLSQRCIILSPAGGKWGFNQILSEPKSLTS